MIVNFEISDKLSSIDWICIIDNICSTDIFCIVSQLLSMQTALALIVIV